MGSDVFLARRRVLSALGAGAVLTAAGCAPTVSTSQPDYPRAYSRKPWAAPRISMDDVIRVIVGHRPYRREGFRVERERFDDTTVVHNYGHGGGGLSLGWGSSALAVREVADLRPEPVAVIGSGIMGLCTARLLQDAGWPVTIYTRDVYRHTTSNVAAGEWGPFSTHDRSQVDAAFLARLDWAARVSHHAYTNLTGAKYGIRWLEAYHLFHSPPGEPRRESYADLFAYQGDLAPGEHPFGNRYARRMVTMQIDPGTLLRQLTADFQLAGGGLVIRDFEDREAVLSLRENVVFNCTGLGAAALFEDAGLIPAKGQLVYLPPDPAVDYMTFGGGPTRATGFLHMFPRGDVLLLGGIFKRGDWSRDVDPKETERMVRGHRELFESFAPQPHL
ncbi:MAG: FAD-dependent oxidoreductase [Woeseiaceae bacterium]|jgi:D-amino-acid oxidase